MPTLLKLLEMEMNRKIDLTWVSRLYITPNSLQIRVLTLEEYCTMYRIKSPKNSRSSRQQSIKSDVHQQTHAVGSQKRKFSIGPSSELLQSNQSSGESQIIPSFPIPMYDPMVLNYGTPHGNVKEMTNFMSTFNDYVDGCIPHLTDSHVDPYFLPPYNVFTDQNITGQHFNQNLMLPTSSEGRFETPMNKIKSDICPNSSLSVLPNLEILSKVDFYQQFPKHSVTNFPVHPWNNFDKTTIHSKDLESGPKISSGVNYPDEHQQIELNLKLPFPMDPENMQIYNSFLQGSGTKCNIYDMNGGEFHSRILYPAGASNIQNLSFTPIVECRRLQPTPGTGSYYFDIHNCNFEEAQNNLYSLVDIRNNNNDKDQVRLLHDESLKKMKISDSNSRIYNDKTEIVSNYSPQVYYQIDRNANARPNYITNLDYTNMDPLKFR